MNALKRLSLFAMLAAGLMAAPQSPAADYAPKLGIQTWTCRNMSFDEVVAFAVKHNIKNVQMISKHIDPNGAPEESLRKKAILEKNGLTCYTFGVNGTSMDKEKNRKLFEFAKLMGIKTIIVEPKNLDEWDNLEQLVKEYDIKLAIHNHGITSVYGNPETVKGILKARDKRIGVCLDVGHVTGAGFDVAKVFKEYDGRVYDIHLKDKKIEKADGKDVILDVDIGTGQSNYKGLFEELKKAKWPGVMAIETDNAGFAKDPNEYITKAQAFFKEHTK